MKRSYIVGWGRGSSVQALTALHFDYWEYKKSTIHGAIVPVGSVEI